jgi:hypothetical protein
MGRSVTQVVSKKLTSMVFFCGIKFFMRDGKKGDERMKGGNLMEVFSDYI